MRKLLAAALTLSLAASPALAAPQGTVNLAAPTGTVGMTADSSGNLANVGAICGAASAAMWAVCVNQAIVNSSGQVLTLDSQSGVWTVQPGNTPNTTAWLVTGTGGTFPVPGWSPAFSYGATLAVTSTSSNEALPTGTVPGSSILIYNLGPSGVAYTLGANNSVTASINNDYLAANNQACINVPSSVGSSGYIAARTFFTGVGATSSLNVSLGTGACNSTNSFQDFSVEIPGETAAFAHIIAGSDNSSATRFIGVTAPGTSSTTYGMAIQGMTGGVPVPVSGALTQTAFVPGATEISPFTASSTSTTTSIPTGSTTLVISAGSASSAITHCTLGAGPAINSDQPIQPGNSVAFNVASATQFSCATSSGTQVISAVAGSGQWQASSSGTPAAIAPAGTSTNNAIAVQGLSGGLAISTSDNIASWNGTAITNTPTAVGTAGTGNTPTVNAYIVGGGGTGGTASSYGSTFPSLGTAIGFEYLSSPPTLTSGQMVAGQVDVNGNQKIVAQAGTAIMGKVGIDQTTVGTTNGVSLAQIGSTTVSTGAGAATGGGVQRVTAAQDTTTIAGSAPGTAGSPSTNVLTVQGISSGTPQAVNTNQWGGTAITNTPTAVGTAGSGNTPTVNAWIVGGAGGGTASSFGSAFPSTGTATGYEYLSSLPTYTNGQMVAPLVNQNGSTLVDINTSGNLYNALTAGSGTQGSTAPTQGVQVGGIYSSSAPTLTTGQFGNLQLGSNGDLKVYLDGCASGGSPCNSNGSATSANSSPVVIASDQAAVAVAPTPYPATAVPITASATGTTAATTATLTNVSGHTTYICGFSIRANATAAATANATVTGTKTATMNFMQWTAPAASGIGTTEEVFSPCIPASAVSTSIAVVSAAPGTGGNVSVTAWGYSL